MTAKVSNAKAEIALMGRVVFPEDNKEALRICEYIVKVVNNTVHPISEEYKEKLKEVTKKHTIIGISVSKIEDMIMINLPLDKMLDVDEANFGYVLNLTEPLFSEYGYSAFNQINDIWFRVG